MAIKKKTPKNKPPKTSADRAKVVRKARTEANIKEIFLKYGDNPFSLEHFDDRIKFNKSMIRAIFKFKKEYKKVCEKYKVLPGYKFHDNIVNVIGEMLEE